MPEISVIVPVYKVEPYLHRCVDSILAQTYKDFELILVDDGSPDNCPAICDEYAGVDSRVHVIHQKNGGLSAARNAGIDWAFANSDSKWLTFIDSDDWVHPKMLERLFSMVETYLVNIGVCGYLETEATTIENSVNGVCALWKPEDFYVAHNTNAVIAWGKIYHKQCFAGIRYPIGRLHEDEFTTYRILFENKKIAVTAEPLYYYFKNEQSITRRTWTPKRIDGLEALEEQIIYFKNKGYIKACRHQVGIYVRKSERIIKEIERWNNNRDNQPYKEILQKKRRELLKKYRKEFICDTANRSWQTFIHFPNKVAMRLLGRKQYELLKGYIKHLINR